jgi:hypothetical protein
VGDVVAAAEAARALRGARALLLVLAVAASVACGRAGSTREPPPLTPTPASTWRYGAYLLSLDDVVGARPVLEQVAGDQLDHSDVPLYLRDLAEARLFSGDLVGAASAAREARTRLAVAPRMAQFQADDRLLVERSIDALQAAADNNQPQLSALAAAEGTFPSADAWYLLAWLAERRGEPDVARVDYRAFLERAPQWTFLRRAVVMRQHAQAALR